MATFLRVYEERPLDLRNENCFFPMADIDVGQYFDEWIGESLVEGIAPQADGRYVPRIDIRETVDALRVGAEMPGVDEKDIDLSLHDGMLTISGVKKFAGEEEENQSYYSLIERSYGCFARDIPLPDTVETDKAGAVFRNGVLTITLPKTRKAVEEPRKIPVAVD